MTHHDDSDGVYEDTAVRLYVLTNGRAHPSRNTIGVDTLLIAADPVRPLPVGAKRQEHALLAMCEGLLSLVEVAARLKLPVSIVRVLASDLVDSGHLTARAGSPSATPTTELLQEILDGLHAL